MKGEVEKSASPPHGSGNYVPKPPSGCPQKPRNSPRFTIKKNHTFSSKRQKKQPGKPKPTRQ
jgi:hypothetical protein